MIRDALHRGDPGQRFHLLHGASYRNEFGYREELEAIDQRYRPRGFRVKREDYD